MKDGEGRWCCHPTFGPCRIIGDEMSASCTCETGAGEAEGEREMDRMRSSKHGSVVGARDISAGSRRV